MSSIVCLEWLVLVAVALSLSLYGTMIGAMLLAYSRFAASLLTSC